MASPSVVVLSLAATLVLSASAAQAQVSFLSAPSITIQARTSDVSSDPSSIVAGDLDGDGDLDIAAAIGYYYAPGSVTVLKNNGNGTFAAQTFAVGYGPRSITVGDLDGDGDLDLATANGSYYSYGDSDNVSVLKNNGNGTFATVQNFAAGSRPLSITVGDLDGDGDLDLATADRGSYPDYVNTVSVLKNNGNGTFAAAQNFAAGDGHYSITVGDLDGDGDLDLATANTSSDDVSVLKNNGNGTFAAPQNFAAGDFPRSITVGDLDGDGDLDLATANSYSDDVSVLKNNGDGTFATAQNFAGGGSAITIGDLDGDGDLDLATSSISVLKNNGDATFAAAQNFPVVEGSPSSVTIGDLDGDGDLDLVTANRSRYFPGYATASVFKNTGNGAFAAVQNFAVGGRPNSITVGDLDGDGDLDLATADRGSYPDYVGTVSVLKNNGNGTFAAAQNFAVGDSPLSITVGDLDGDGDLDLATANASYLGYYGSGSVSVLKNNGNGTFATVQNFSVAYGYASPAITIGDLDGDGDLDLSTVNRGGDYSFVGATVSVLKNNGNGTFAAQQNFDVGNRLYFITVGDLDRDGDLDIATANGSTNSVAVLQSTTPTLQLSPSPSRVNPVPLAGESVSGTIYVFASGKDLDFKRVQFYLDDPDRSGEPIRLERSAPFDFAGGTNMDPTLTQANPFDTTTLTNGTHTITATFARTDGTFRTITSTFTVGN